MTNASLKNKIEKLTNTKIKNQTYKAGSLNFEGTSTAYPETAERFKSRGKWFYRAESVGEGSSYGHRTGAQAVKASLISLANELGVHHLAEEAANDNQNYNDAEFNVRTNRV